MNRIITFTVLGLLVLADVAWSQEAPLLVKDVAVRTSRNSPIDEQSVLAFTRVRVGQEFSRQDLAADVRNLQQTDRFAYVSAKIEKMTGGVRVIYVVDPKPRIRKITVRGAEELGNAKVKKMLNLNRGDTLDELELAVKLQEVRKEYREKHFPFVDIKYSVTPVEGSVLSDVFVNVFEGTRSKVRQIKFEGNYAISDKQLRKAMQQRKAGLLSFLSGSGTLEADVLETDLLALKDVYRNEAYLDVKVGQPTVTKTSPKKIEITIPIEEGRQYRVREVRIEGTDIFPVERIAARLGVQPNNPASIRSIERDRSMIRDYYGSRGYIRTGVKYQLIADPAEPEVDVIFNVNEGRLGYIRDIDVRGNTRTKDKVIRRELTVYPGDIFNQVKVRNSGSRVRNLGFFSRVDPVVENTQRDDQFDLVFDVEEQKTGSFIAGAGFSSVDDLIGFVEVSQGNFDLAGWPHFTGAGQKIKVRATLGTSRRDYEISFVEPWFLNRKLSLGVDGFQHDRRFLSDDYDQRNTGGSVSLSKPISSFWRAKLGYTLEEIDVRDVDENASDLIKAEEGKQTQSAATFTLTHDSRNKFFIPTRGNRTRLSAKGAGGPLGFDTDLYRLELRSTQYIPLWYEHVLNIRGFAQVVEEYGDSDRVPIFDRLFLGGARTVRGFKFRDIGPKDEVGEPLGGKSSMYGTVEYTIPLVERFRFASFYDTGMVNTEAYDWGTTDINSSYGLGMRIDMPGFPLQLDYSWQLESDEFNDRNAGRFSFLIGYFF